MYGQSMQVLYVEDDMLMAKNVELILHKEGHFCHTTDLGERAVELAKRNAYDIIILDIMLPDIDGYEVIERLKDAGIAVPVLVQSGLVDRDNDPEGLGLGLGSRDFLIKPFDKYELIEAMERAVAHARNAGHPDPAEETERPGRPRYDGQERRRHRRFGTIKAGQILHKKMRTDCVVLNISHGGAAIRLPKNRLNCPENFALKLEAEPLIYCRVCWRFRDKIGVRFIGR